MRRPLIVEHGSRLDVLFLRHKPDGNEHGRAGCAQEREADRQAEELGVAVAHIEHGERDREEHHQHKQPQNECLGVAIGLRLRRCR